MGKKKINMGRLGRVIPAVAFVCLAVAGIRSSDWRGDVRLTLTVRADERKDYGLVVDDHSLRARSETRGGYRVLVFDVPHRRIHRIRFHAGRGPGEVRLKRVSVTTLLSGHHWEGRDLEKLFTHRSQVGRLLFRDGELFIPCLGREPVLTAAAGLAQAVNKMASRKDVYYLLALIAGILLFYLTGAVDPRELVLFFASGRRAVLILPFLLLITFPLVNSLVGLVSPMPIVELRGLARKPVWRLDSLPRSLSQFTRYTNDHFVLRNAFIHLHNRLMFGLFRTSTVPLVVVGKEGWLFMGRESTERDEMVYYRAIRPFSGKELADWARILEARRRWLARRGIDYLFVVAPNKSTVYSEFLPDRIRPPVGPSRLDQLFHHLKAHTRVEFLDLRSALERGKRVRRVYRKTDSHWSEYGAYLVYREIFEVFRRRFPEAEPMPLSNFRVVVRDEAGGDLAAGLTLEKRMLRERAVRLESTVPLTARTVDTVQLTPYVTRSIARSSTGSLPAALMVHDSFIHELRPFLAEHFSRMIFIWDWDLNFYTRLIEKHRPWIVIDEMAERFLCNPVPANPEPLDLPERE